MPGSASTTGSRTAGASARFCDTPSTGRWTVAARSPRYSGRSRPPAVVEGHGGAEIAALTDLSLKLDELRAAERAIEERARAAYLHGAEEHSRATLGRPLTPDELERVLRWYAR